MIGEEIRRSNLKHISQLQYVTRRRLDQIYKELARSLPDDPAGLHYSLLMRAAETPLSAAAKQVLQQIGRAAADNRSLPVGTNGGNQPARREGDALTEYLVREAARAARSLPEEVASTAFLLGTAIGLDTSQTMANPSAVAGAARTVELPSERMIRLTVLGSPTMRGRLDVTQHFFQTAYSTAANAAEAPAWERELQNADRPGGLSFKVIAADRAGSRFGRSLMDKRITLGMIVSAFDVASFMPPVDSLPDSITAERFASQYGKASDPRFLQKLREIDERILLLPAYRPADSFLSR
jgi:hypothetical protein